MADEKIMNNESLAYIEKETYALRNENADVARISDAVLAKAKELMEKLDEADLTTESQTRDKSKTYTDKMVVKVEPATKFNEETQQQEPMTYKDGSPVYKATAELKHKGTTLALFAKEDSGEAKFVAMSASKWSREAGKPARLDFFKEGDIARANINADIKKIAEFVKDNGYLEKDAAKEAQKNHSMLKNFAYEANQYFAANSEKVQNENGDMVNDAYAKFETTDFGDKLTIHNHTDNVAVELGITSKGDKFARAINYDLNEAGDARAEGEAPAKVYLNNADDIAKFIDNKEIQDIVSEFKGVSKEKVKEEKAKPQVERD